MLVWSSAVMTDQNKKQLIAKKILFDNPVDDRRETRSILERVLAASFVNPSLTFPGCFDKPPLSSKFCLGFKAITRTMASGHALKPPNALTIGEFSSRKRNGNARKSL